MLKTLNKNQARLIFLASLAFMFCAHAFCYMNLTLSTDAVAINVGGSGYQQAQNGAYLASFYWKVRGGISSPLLIGLISALCLSAASLFTAELLGLTNPLSLIALCGLMTTHISVTSINAAQLHLADTYFVALLLAAVGVWLVMRMRFGFFFASALFCACAAMQPSMLRAGVGLLALALLHEALTGDHFSAVIKKLLLGALSLLVGFALYAAGYHLLLMVRGQSSAAYWQIPGVRSGLSLPLALAKAWFAPIGALLEPTTAYATLSPLLSILLLACSVLALLLLLSKRTFAMRALSLALALALPLLLTLPVYAGAEMSSTWQSYPFCFLMVFALLILDHAAVHHGKRALQYAVFSAFAVTMLSSVIFGNQVYLKKNLEFQSTLSAMTRVVDYAERTEGFKPGYTPVAIVGTLNDSSIAMIRDGFAHLLVLDACENVFAPSTQSQTTQYFWQILGYPFNFVSDMERDALAESAAVQAMPAFPAQDCCQMIEDTLVIKLSP